MELLDAIDRFGAPSILGRLLYRKEVRAMRMADNIRNAFQMREASDDWAEWAKANPDLNDLLNEAIRNTDV